MVLRLVALLIFMVPALPAHAMCVSYKDSVRQLTDKYGEQLYDHDQTTEFWLNMDTGTYTILARMGDLACFLKSGRLNTMRLKEMHMRELDL
jgi:hypothetical protein